MMRAPLLVLGLMTLAQSVSSSRNTTHRAEFDWDETKYVIAFGDSYSFVQGTAGLPNYSFIGSYLPTAFSFSPTTLLSNQIVQNLTGTAEGGPNWLEYLTNCGLEDLYTSLSTCPTQLWDFAFAGAEVTSEFLPRHHNFTVQMVNQTQQYLSYAEPVIGRLMDKSHALVSIWIGINDINACVQQASGPPLKALLENIVRAVFAQTVLPMFEAGYRHFLLLTLPPLDRTSANQKAVAPRPSKEEVGWWDGLLGEYMAGFAREHSEANMLLYDANSFLNGVLDSPEEYGIRNTTDWCAGWDQERVLTAPEDYGCLPLDQYFWYNSGHMTSHTHKVMVPDLVKYLRSQSRKGERFG